MVWLSGKGEKGEWLRRVFERVLRKKRKKRRPCRSRKHDIDNAMAIKVLAEI